MSPFGVFRKPVTVTRPAQGSFVNGIWVDGTTTTLTIDASVQPANTNDLQSLPENRRTLGVYVLYSDVPFQSAIENKQNPDIVKINGEDYEIAKSMPWQNDVVSHYKAMAVRVQPS